MVLRPGGGAGVAQGLVIGCTWLFLKGTGIWGVTIPGAWGFAIINFVWWIGIGHADADLGDSAAVQADMA